MNLTIEIPANKAKDLSRYAEEIGGRLVSQKANEEKNDTETDDEEVTHGEYFGENIRRAIKILRKK